MAQGRQTQKPLVAALMATTTTGEATPAGRRTIRLAAIDMGSNSFHLLVVEAHADGHFETLVSEKEMLGLGEIVANHGFITEEAAELAIDTMRRFVTIARSKQAEEITAYATSAIRDAENSSEVVARISADVDVRVEVISGQTEARLIFAAMRASITMDATPVIGFDLGGGSVEIMVGDQQSMMWATSVGLGVARLATLMHDDPPSPSDVSRVRDHLTGVLRPITDRVKPFKPRLAIGSSGTLSDLVRMAEIHRCGRNPAGVNQLTVQRADLLAVHEELMSLPLAKRRRLPGLEQRRAALVPAGSLFLTVAMELFGLDELTGCEWALREGMILDAIARHDLVDWTGEDSAIRRTSVLALARRCGWDEAHGRQVAR
ncbi:MAG: Ppx/GppA family phosphatase, partial [Actinobacteria bacterium]|nr:Ppx/GppA family phosphatase [Actinomycetota bacterium]